MQSLTRSGVSPPAETSFCFSFTFLISRMHEQIMELTDIRDKTIHTCNIFDTRTPQQCSWVGCLTCNYTTTNTSSIQVPQILNAQRPTYNSVTNSSGGLIFNNEQVKFSPALRVWSHTLFITQTLPKNNSTELNQRRRMELKKLTRHC